MTNANRDNDWNIPHFPHPPRRVVSLVPSYTESLFDLGLGEAVVGITDYCLHPAQALESLPRLGGTKNPRLEEILALQPDLVLANWEENTRQTVEALRGAGIPVWVSFPKTVRQSLDLLWAFADTFHSPMAAARLETLERTLEWVRSAVAAGPRIRYFCPIWQGKTSEGVLWWMTFNQDTYPHDLLDVLGGENVFASRERRYPLSADLGQGQPQDPEERDTRYPRVSLEEIRAARPGLILLPNEPFAYDETHRQQLEELLGDTPAVRHGNIHLLDGSLITWHGTRLGRALQELPRLFSENP